MPARMYRVRSNALFASRASTSMVDLERLSRGTGTTLAFDLPFGSTTSLLRSCRTKNLTLVARENAETAHAIVKKIMYLSCRFCWNARLLTCHTYQSRRERDLAYGMSSSLTQALSRWPLISLTYAASPAISLQRGKLTPGY